MLSHLFFGVSKFALLSSVACLLAASAALAAPAPSRGDQLANDGNYAAALQAFAAAQKQSPDDAALAANLARVSLRLQQNESAVDWAKKAVDLAPGKATYRLLLADAYVNYVNDVSVFSKLGIAHKIRDGYLKAVELEPDNAEAHFSLAMFYLMAPGIAGGDDDKGEEQVKLLARIDPAHVAIVRAQQAVRTEDFDTAKEWMSKAVSAAKDSSGYVAQAALLVSQDHPEEALKVYRKATTTYPDEPTAWYQIGKLAAIGNVDPLVGIQALETYLGMRINWRDRDAPFSWAHYRLGQIHERVGAVQKARDEYQQALKLNPDFPEATQALQKLPESGKPAEPTGKQGAQAHVLQM